ncbi:M10 family metallopeptidase C-terminal domain-containing protein [Donghicola mangrovi]|uniref:Cyclic nucleotide-binding domain-containing protein n=1 Tax=Donghicola mangrovi TaxID=2729614 RepID=A0A850QBF1_9RHOB|nr:M10 family metallopeptidase C-terminal domain-containing protein [Donghicola mangrovi]NVO23775.1 hypothetical protein [Donghicola mangrovi]
MQNGSLDDMVYQLRHGYFEWSGGVDGHWRKFNFGSSGWFPKNNKIKVHFDEDDPIPQEIKDIVKDSFRYVADVMNIDVSFKVGDGDDGDVNIHRVDDWDAFFGGTEFAAASADLGLGLPFTDRDHYQDHPDISFELSAFDLDDPYSVMEYRSVFIHEFTHLLGLGHLGDYNGTVSSSERVFSNDSRGYSIMSYVAPNQFEPGIFDFSSRPWTYREVDLLALDMHYNIDFSMEEEATRWGFNGNVSHSFINENFDLLEQQMIEVGGIVVPALTIIDTGGEDELNLRSSAAAFNFDAVLDLRSGQYSDILGGVNNLWIQQDSVIENAITAGGADHITGNRVANEISAGGNSDTVLGAGGNDTLYGEDGADSLEGGAGRDELWGGAQDDTLYGDGGGDRLYGGDDADLIEGGGGNDTLNGEEGLDTVYGNAGKDKIYLEDGGNFYGGSGNDTFWINDLGAFAYTVDGETNKDILRFATSSSSAGFLLDMTTRQVTNLLTGNSAVVNYAGLEQIKGSVVNDIFVVDEDAANAFTDLNGYDGEDHITVLTSTIRVNGGDHADDLIVAASGAYVRGGKGNDNFVIEGVNASIGGQRGRDVVLFDASTDVGVSVDTGLGLYGYGQTLAELTEETSGDFSGFVRYNTGTNLTLTFNGSNRRDVVYGGDLNDEITGNGGADLFHGQGGEDTLSGGTGADILYGEGGADTLYGGVGDDTLYGGGGSDWIETGYGDDSVEAGSGDDTIICGSGFEMLRGDDGDDLFVVETGQKQINGGSGEDTLEFLGKLDRIVDLGETKYNDELGLTVDFVNIENVITQDGTDSITGNSADNLLIANDGNDTLEGRGGDDTLNGGAGADLAVYQSGNDITVDLTEGVATGEGTDTLIGIEDVTTASGDDELTGNDEDNVLTANDGNDLLAGNGGNDRLYGGTGNDTVLAGNGEDTATGGEGYDTLGFDEGLSGVIFSLAVSTAQDVGSGSITASGFEALLGTDGHDELTGDNDDNLLEGQGGNDTLVGLRGSDVIDGGAGRDSFIALSGDGDDIYDGGGGSDWLDFSFGEEAVDIKLSLGEQDLGSYGTDSWVRIENVRGTKFGDSIVGDPNDNALEGGKGNDLLAGGKGADDLNGGVNDDTLWGELGNDTLTGGRGADTFQFKSGHGQDLIADFNGKEGDVIVLSGVEHYDFEVIGDWLSLRYGEEDWISFKSIEDPDAIIANLEIL